MEFSKLLEERRSIRKFDPEKKVTADQIKEIINAAIQAPSWKNSQTTRYYAVVTPEKSRLFPLHARRSLIRRVQLEQHLWLLPL